MANVLRVDLEKSRTLLKTRLLELMPEEGDHFTSISGFALHRFNSDERPRPMMYKPVVIIVVQGSKWAKIGENEYIYGEHTCFVSGVGMPITSCIREVSPEKPYLSMSLDLDKSVIAQLVAQVMPEPHPGKFMLGASVQEVDVDLLDAFLRLVELLNHPNKVNILAPLIIKEIHYHLLTGPLGKRLRAIHTVGTQGNQIARAIAWLMENYSKPFQVNELAQHLNMATSTLHKHFKEVTTVSPLQYQKKLRLFEAQRLMLNDMCDASQASVKVGYDSLPQFNREYKRLFGEPPRRDVSRLKKDINRFNSQEIARDHLRN